MRELGSLELGRPLQEVGWCFRFDRARRRLGSCQWRRGSRTRKWISISAVYVRLLGLSYRDDQGLLLIEDVIRHEIAHAIDFEHRDRSDHGEPWKTICRRIGADPTRLYDVSALPSIPGKYAAVCPSCGLRIAFYRAPTRPRACRECCNRYASGRYDDRFRLAIVGGF